MVDIIFGLMLFLPSFFATVIFIKYWIIVAKKNGLTGKDMNKTSKTEVAESGGVGVAVGIIVAILLYVFLKTFVLKIQSDLIEVLITLASVLMACFIGFIDDILGWKRGLKQWQKPLLTIPIAVPLMVINAGNSMMSLPFLGEVDFGILFPLLIIPIAIVGASNGFNMLAGYNGLEAGMGSIILSVLGLVAWQSGNAWIAHISFASVFALLGFLIYNWYPAKIFPGNSLTYSIGALIATLAILGDMEKIALILFVPYFITFFLKLRTRFKAESFAKVNTDGSLSKPYEKFYDLTHVSISILGKLKKKVYEKDVVLFILGVEILVTFLCLYI